MPTLLDDTRNTSGTTDEDDFVNVGLVNLGVVKDLPDGFESGAKEGRWTCESQSGRR